MSICFSILKTQFSLIFSEAFGGGILKNVFNGSFHTYKYAHNKNNVFNNQSSIESHELRSVENGKIVVICQGKTITATKGDLLYIPFGREAEIKIYANTQCRGTVMRTVYMPKVDVLGYPPQAIKMSNELKRFFNDIPIFNPCKDSINAAIIWKVYRFLDQFEKEVTKYTDKHSLKIQKALQFMKENDDYTIKEVAEHCGMSESRFRATFSKILGTSPIQMKHRIQSVKADALLKTTDLSVDEIANRVGYFSSNQLRNVMKKRYGALPKELRNAIPPA